MECYVLRHKDGKSYLVSDDPVEWKADILLAMVIELPKEEAQNIANCHDAMLIRVTG